jgi:hypothetical protein
LDVAPLVAAFHIVRPLLVNDLATHQWRVWSGLGPSRMR